MPDFCRRYSLLAWRFPACQQDFANHVVDRLLTALWTAYRRQVRASKIRSKVFFGLTAQYER